MFHGGVLFLVGIYGCLNASSLKYGSEAAKALHYARCAAMPTPFVLLKFAGIQTFFWWSLVAVKFRLCQCLYQPCVL